MHAIQKALQNATKTLTSIVQNNIQAYFEYLSLQYIHELFHRAHYILCQLKNVTGMKQIVCGTYMALRSFE